MLMYLYDNDILDDIYCYLVPSFKIITDVFIIIYKSVKFVNKGRIKNFQKELILGRCIIKY